jgi:hypothetical protein
MRRLQFCTVAALTLTATPVLAQSIWTPIDHRPFIRVEALHPSLKTGGGADVSTLTGALFVTGGMPFGRRASGVIEIPYAHSKISGFGESSSNSSFGNPYLGVQFGTLPAAHGFVGEIGVRPKMVKEKNFEATLIGGLTDFDRADAFSDATSLAAVGNFYSRVQQANTRLRLGVTHEFVGTDYGDDETLLDYGALGSVDVDWLRLGAAITGRYILTESGSFGDRSIHHIAGSASLMFGQMRPGILVRVPLDKDVKEILRNTFGLTFEYTFR